MSSSGQEWAREGTRPVLASHLAAFAALVHRYRGEDDLRLWVTHQADPSPDGLSRPAQPPLQRISLGDDPTVEDLLSRAGCVLAAIGGPAVHLELMGRIHVTWEDGDGQVEQSGAKPGFTLLLELSPAGQLSAKLFHHDRLCPGTTPLLMDGHFRTLLESLAGDRTAQVSRLPMITPDERHTILERWSGPAHDPELCRDELLHELFEAQVDARPGQIALECAGEQMTYAQLDVRSNQLACRLRSGGMRAGDFVGIYLPRSADVVIAILGVLKAGGAYVPLDSDYPADRVQYILDDCKVQSLITVSSLAARLEPGTWSAVLMDKQPDKSPSQPSQRVACRDTGVAPDSACYVIYTSGSTGRPKGVLITHHNACNLVRGEGRIFGVVPDDRVFQGFSVAFDASVEEIWLALFAGATLVVGTADMVHAGPALAGLLARAKVTVFSTVPTLLSTFEEDIPSLRLLILGGEACTQNLVRRWCRPGLRVVNTYGPTEATVIATYADCEPDKPVTIGRAAPNYRTYILDRHLQPVPVGVCGELHIGGVGVAAGYLGRPELTADRFVPNPFMNGQGGRLYKTGDLVRYCLDGQIEFVGRLDTQIKLRGFRIELSEIESVLLRCPAVQAAVTVVREDSPGLQQLVGYIVPRQGQDVDEDAVKKILRAQLPVFMVPGLLEIVDKLPTLASGKVDRKRLPAPRPRQVQPAENGGAFVGDLEPQLGATWRELFAPTAVGPLDDFFKDLGGHSLLAARMVSRMRQRPEFCDLSVLDVYNFPTVRTLAAELRSRHEAVSRIPGAGASPLPVRPTSRGGYGLCVLAQTVSLWVIAGLFSMQWLTPYLAYCWLIERGMGVIDAIAVSLAVLLAFYPLLMAASIAVKWAVIGRYKAGDYPLWGWYYLRWWFVNQVLSVVPIDYLAGTPLLSLYYRLMGARIGHNVYFGADNISAFDLVSVGEDSSLGIETMLMGYSLEGGRLRLGPVTVGRNCFIGARSVLRPYTVMEDGARLEDLSLLPEGGRIPRGQTWIGSPARPIWQTKRQTEAIPPAVRPGRLRRAAFAMPYVLGVLLVPAVCLIALFPGLIWLNYVTREYGGYWFLLLAPAVTLAFVLLMALEIVLVKWLLLGRVRPGTYDVHGWFYFRKWFVDQLMDLSLDLLGPLYATLYLAPWYRLLGAKLGRRAEVSTASATSPDLLAIDDGSFIADAVCLGASRVEGGRVTLAPTRIGKRAFVGNSAFVPAGAVIGDDVLIGCMSAPPQSPDDAARAGTSWLGSPAFFLPQRQESTAFSAEQTFRPSRRLVLLRAFIEFFRITLPITCFVALTSLLITVVIDLRQVSTPYLVLAFPALYLGFGVAAALVVVACKWLLMGRYRPAEKPLWSSFVWRTELVTAMHEHLADPFLVMLLLGTPWVCWFFRLLGAKVGRRVVMETTYLTEFDLITIGDRAVLGSECTIQTHLFEDRVMKMSTIDIGNDCTVGAGSIVLYDTRMESRSALGDLSLLMKGEDLPADTQWEGTPARLLPAREVAGGRQPMPDPGDHREPAKAGPAAPEVSFLFSLDQYDAHPTGPWVWVLDCNHAGGNVGLPLADTSGALLQGAKEPPSERTARLAGRGPAIGVDRLPARDLLRRLIGMHLGLRPEEVALDVNPQGGLLLAAERMPACPMVKMLKLNVAHSQDVLVAGVSLAGRIGVDVELMRPEIDLTTVAGECFTVRERQHLETLSADKRVIGFYTLWTAKEAFVKAIGHGLFFGLDQIELTLEPDGSARLARVNGRSDLARAWRIVHRVVNVGGLPAVVAVALGE